MVQKGNPVMPEYLDRESAGFFVEQANHRLEYNDKKPGFLFGKVAAISFITVFAVDGRGGKLQEIPNDFAWIFAGGTPPNAFLEKIGVGLGARDMTLEAGNAAKEVILAKKQLVVA